MAITIIERRTCDWCSEDDEKGRVVTHTLAFNRVVREVELHDKCQADATLGWLLEHGRRLSANRATEVTCPVCHKPAATPMGLAQHLSRSHPDLSKTKRQEILREARGDT